MTTHVFYHADTRFVGSVYPATYSRRSSIEIPAISRALLTGTDSRARPTVRRKTGLACSLPIHFCPAYCRLFFSTRREGVQATTWHQHRTDYDLHVMTGQSMPIPSTKCHFIIMASHFRETWLKVLRVSNIPVVNWNFSASDAVHLSVRIVPSEITEHVDVNASALRTPWRD